MAWVDVGGRGMLDGLGGCWGEGNVGWLGWMLGGGEFWVNS